MWARFCSESIHIPLSNFFLKVLVNQIPRFRTFVPALFRSFARLTPAFQVLPLAPLFIKIGTPKIEVRRSKTKTTMFPLWKRSQIYLYLEDIEDYFFEGVLKMTQNFTKLQSREKNFLVFFGWGSNCQFSPFRLRRDEFPQSCGVFCATGEFSHLWTNWLELQLLGTFGCIVCLW